LLLIPIIGSGLLFIVALVLLRSRARRQRQTVLHRRSTQEFQSEQKESFDDELTHYKHIQTEFGSGDQSNDARKSVSRPTLSTSDSSFSLWSTPDNIDNTFETPRGYDSEGTDSYVTNSLLRTLNSDVHLVGRRVRYDQVHFFSMLSRGAYGEVWLCEFDRQQVAVKRMRQNKDIKFSDIQDFIREIQVSASLEHPNIVRVLGVAWNTLSNLCMVIDYLPRGDLQSYLRKHGDLLTWGRDKVFLAIGIAQALEYLHTREPPLIHRDLKSKNVLLTRTLDPQLIDFGISRRRKEETMTAGVGTPYWTAPEVLAGERYTEQSDIHSFGVLLTELDTCEVPFYDVEPPDEAKMRPIQIMNGVMSGELRPSFRDDCPARIRRLGLACLEQDPSSRPTARETLQTLDR
jgi:mitogen-activated protein kinase kinase kinase 7